MKQNGEKSKMLHLNGTLGWGLAALAAVVLIVIAMNAVFWGMKPAAPRPEQKETV